MNHDEMRNELRTARETMLRASDIIGRAIERFEAMRPVSDAFQQWQNVQQAQGDALKQAGGPHLLDVEAQAHHTAEVRRAEARLTEVLRAYFASGGEGQASDGGSQPDAPSPSY